MPLLVRQTLSSTEPKEINVVALDGSSDSFPYNNERSFLMLQNTGSSNITMVLLGNSATTVDRSGITEIDVSGGKSVTVNAGDTMIVDLTNASAFLSDSDNQPDITGGTADINAALFTL